MPANITGLEGIAFNITDLNQCTPELCSLHYASLRYIPNLGANATFVGIFTIFLTAQIILWLSFRTHSYTFSIICGLILEIIGYAFRIVMRKHMFSEGPFLIQIICITIAPVFFTAALYLTFSRVIAHHGIHNSRLSPKTYTIGFIASDVLALVLQSAGGAIAETANDRATSKAGTNIMVGGLAFQVASLVVFGALAAEFFWRVKTDRNHIRATNWAYGVPEKPAGDIDGLKTFLYACTFATGLILIRSCFRVAELVDGFRSKLANDEVLFMTLEGAMIILATLILTFFHPGRYFRREMWKESGWSGLKNGRSSPELWKVESAGSSVHGSYENVSRPWPLQQ
ncbi:RTA1 like protein-domain-containing protein [Rhexocercosporidium sp. MPI-PUGE-AT-0058]|nr:RTA1 like protein-domain-containing protein [Rhexocercosporidium sp. MPI-PUGE-AT-0058]